MEKMITIPKKLHFIWIGNEKMRPDNCIDSWRKLHPDYEITVWGNEAYNEHRWMNAKHIKQMAEQELCGVADMMRYEILFNYGGIALDADSYCIRRIDDWILEPNDFSCWENEHCRPGLIATGAIGATPGSELMMQIIKEILFEETVTNDMAWKTVGPLRLTSVWKKYNYPLTIYPSHYFIPEHFSGLNYFGKGPVYCRQLWGSTRKDYDKVTKFQNVDRDA